MSANKRKKLTKDERIKLHTMFNCCCAYCGCHIDYNEMTADHINPLERNGQDKFDNIFPACTVCNNFKNHFKIEQFRQNIQNLAFAENPNAIELQIIQKYNIKPQSNNKIAFYFENR